jgi:competence protein ComFC
MLAACRSATIVLLFQEIPPGHCDICGQPGAFDPEFPKEISCCEDCQRQRFAFQSARSYGLYEGTLARAIALLKHEAIEPLGNWFGERLAQVVQKEAGRVDADAIVSSALHRLRRRERGFNQVDLVGRPLARRLKLPYQPVVLVHSRPRPEKHLLPKEERWEAVRGAFALGKGHRVDNLRILLLDDVMTTGATLDACTRALCEAGAKSVVGLTIARAGQPISSFGTPRSWKKDGR